MKFILKPGQLKLSDLRLLADENTSLELDPHCYPKIEAAEKLIAKTIASGKTVYGVNTGFGALANTRIPNDELETLQRSLVLSHATGTGELLSDKVVRLVLALKINSLTRGFSGVRRETIDALIQFYNHHLCPCIPEKGSVGASGDLAPLAHLSAALLGVGDVRFKGKIITAKEALKKIHLRQQHFFAKEGLALVNGTQVSTALALLGLWAIEDVFVAAIIAGSLSLDAARGSDEAFDERIQLVRGYPTQIQVASLYRALLEGSQIRESHRHCGKVQDPYSLRCQPQVMGACLSSILHAQEVLLTEANAVSDNPLVFVDQKEILSGGNFHAEPVALVADALAVAIAEVAAISERRIALLVDPHFSGLPAFLVKNPGINSGFMLAQVTAASLASENKSLAHPGSVDNIPTSANQEDHVSMATFAARRLHAMAENAATIVGIELLAAAQGIDLLHPQKTSPKLEKIHKLIRAEVKFYDKDRFFAPDIAKIKAFVQSGRLRDELPSPLFADHQRKQKSKTIKTTTHG